MVTLKPALFQTVLVRSESDLISLLVRYALFFFTKKERGRVVIEFLSSAVSSSWVETQPWTGILQLFGILYA